MNWSRLTFGKHKGKTLPQVMFKDPDWFFYAYKMGYFKDKGQIEIEAKNILHKSINVRIPDKKNKPQAVIVIIHKPTGTYGRMVSIDKEKADKMVYPPDFVFDRINMAFPFTLKQYDKFSYRLLIIDIKNIVFGGKIKMTKKRCEDFFSDDDNFML